MSINSSIRIVVSFLCGCHLLLFVLLTIFVSVCVCVSADTLLLSTNVITQSMLSQAIHTQKKNLLKTSQPVGNQWGYVGMPIAFGNIPKPSLCWDNYCKNLGNKNYRWDQLKQVGRESFQVRLFYMALSKHLGIHTITR